MEAPALLTLFGTLGQSDVNVSLTLALVFLGSSLVVGFNKNDCDLMSYSSLDIILNYSRISANRVFSHANTTPVFDR